MITQYSNPQLITRLVTDSYGRQFELSIVVACIDGVYRGRVIGARLVSAVASLPGEVTASHFCLPCALAATPVATLSIPAFAPLVSPYTELYFLTSQPTRAPSFA